ncbi:unnamed protein product, partial [marine sediment metagenome]
IFADFIKNVSLEEGISRMSVWAKRVGTRESQKFDKIEVEKNMPLSWQIIVAK